MFQVEERCSSSNIQKLPKDNIFVFGSNLRGLHGAGAAKTAVLKFKAQMGTAVGATGKAYAIPTKDANLNTLELKEIHYYVNQFIRYAKNNPTLTFHVTEIGCGLAGYLPQSIAPLFQKAKDVKNILLPERFWQFIK